MKKMTQMLALFLALIVLTTGCGTTATPSSAASAESSAADSAAEGVAILCTDKSCGNVELQTEMGKHEMPYEGELTGEMLAEGLTELTGLDFFVTITERDDGLAVDWHDDSTLIANLDDRPQKDAFHMYDSDSLRWFMMDSLWWTLQENFGVDTIYYTMNGGEDLAFEELWLQSVFPAELPFMGSGFYYGHMSDDVMDEEAALSLVREAMAQRSDESHVLVATEAEIIDNEFCLCFAAGENSADGQKFTAMSHYAVSESGVVYYMDVLEGPDWLPLDPSDSEWEETHLALIATFAEAFFGGIQEGPTLHGETGESILYTFVSPDGEERAVEFELHPAFLPEEQMFYLEASEDGEPVTYRVEMEDTPCLIDEAGTRITPQDYA